MAAWQCLDSTALVIFFTRDDVNRRCGERGSDLVAGRNVETVLPLHHRDEREIPAI